MREIRRLRCVDGKNAVLALPGRTSRPERQPSMPPFAALTLFNAYYGEYCYMPLLLFEGRSGKLILPILRPGRGNKAINIAGLLKRLILKLRKKWKHTQIIDR